jgi:hypothetical protein
MFVRWKTNPYIPESLLRPKERCVINSHFLSSLRESGITKQRIPDWGGIKAWLRTVPDRLHCKTSEQNTVKERKTPIPRRVIMFTKTYYHHHDGISLTTFFFRKMKHYRLNRK